MKTTRRTSLVAARVVTILLASTLSPWSTPALAQVPPERLTDRDVKALIDQVDEARDKFEGNLDDTLKGSTLRGPNGEMSVRAILQDYQDNTKKLQHRFDDHYAAGLEVATVLKQATAIDRFMQGTSSVMKGRMEWDREAAALKHLAAAYGTTFPMPDSAGARRMNDDETADTAAAIVTAAKRLKDDDLDAIAALPKPEKDAVKREIEMLIKLAETVKDRTSDGKSAITEVRQLVEQVRKVQPFVDAHQAPAIMTNWQTVRASLESLQQAFGLIK